jgi:hypothetical protein
MSILSRGTKLITRFYSRLGFANRKQLTHNLKDPALKVENQPLLLDRMASEGILKERFRRNIDALNQLEPHMLSGRTTLDKIKALGIDNLESDPLFAEKNRILSKLTQGISAGYNSISQFAHNSESLALVFSSGLKAAKGIGITLGIGGAIWFFGIPSFTPGVALAGATALCVLAAKYNDKLPTHGFYGALGKTARFLSRKWVAPLLYALDGLYLGYLTHETNLRITGIFDAIGLEGTTAVMLSLLLATNHFIRKNIKGLKDSYGGQLDPGEKKYMRQLMAGASYSTVGEIHYLGTRLLLLGAASTYLFINTASALGTWGVLPIALPFLFYGATHLIRARKRFTYSSEKQAKRSDRIKTWTPLAGLGAGMLAAIIKGIHSSSYLPVISYATLYGSLATLFISELHGIFHSFNTNMGFIASLQTSSRDLLGEEEKKRLTENTRVYAVNPHTGTKEIFSRK